LQETLELTIDCYFNKQIDQIITSILPFISSHDKNFERLLKYFEKAEKDISDELAKAIILQFNIRNSLLEEGKRFFKGINKQKYLNFIIDIESKNDENVLKFLKNDIQFAVTIARTLKNFPSLRKKIIQNLPDDKNIQKEKLLLLLNYDEENFDEAFSILKSMDLSNLWDRGTFRLSHKMPLADTDRAKLIKDIYQETGASIRNLSRGLGMGRSIIGGSVKM